MPALNESLQVPFARAFSRILRDAHVATRPRAKGPDEVDWIETFHALVDANLERDFRDASRAEGVQLSLGVHSELVHGNPFQVIPEWRHGRSKVEIGDLLLVGERHDRRLGLVERQALLLQMKVGKPVLHKNRVAGETRQAALYAYWPPINWAAASLRDRLPPPFPRQTSPHPGNATAFGIIPRSEDGSFDCHLVSSGPSLDPPGSLAAKMAYSIRLNLAVDATPGPENGWPRIVQDIMDRAGFKSFRERSGVFPNSDAVRRHHDGGAQRARSLVVIVALGDVGLLD